jgi:protein-tyrosine phosphatase
MGPAGLSSLFQLFHVFPAQAHTGEANAPWTEIAKNLYLGGKEALLDAVFMAKIQAVLSLTFAPVPPAMIGEGLHLPIQIDDQPHCSLLEHFAKCSVFIKKHLSAGRTVLVHCGEGRSRSASVVLFYMCTTGWSLLEAAAHVKRVRPAVAPNPGFLCQLALAAEGLRLPV